jgi:ABC-type cobalamin transport system ATPase subunit
MSVQPNQQPAQRHAHLGEPLGSLPVAQDSFQRSVWTELCWTETTAAGEKQSALQVVAAKRLLIPMTGANIHKMKSII